MNPESYPLWIFPAALALDIAIGDPYFMPHPIRWMGRAIQMLEPGFRARFFSLKVSGGVMAVFLIFSTWLLNWILLKAAFGLHHWLGWCLSVVLLFYAISIRSLAASAMNVWKALVQKDLNAARKRLGMIVGRQVEQLDEHGIVRAAVETVAENLVDGVVSPIFFAFLGGPAMAMAYKMVNTLDSMIGYRNAQYRQFGFLAAKIDDAANYLPARLVVPVIAVAAQLLGKQGMSVLRVVKRDSRRHTSPNAGYPEAAFAGALRLRLGGPNIYHGQQVDKPLIGSGLHAASEKHIPMACDLMVLTSVLWSGLGWGLFVVVTSIL